MDENNNFEAKFEKFPGSEPEKKGEGQEFNMDDAPEFRGDELLGGTGELDEDDPELVTEGEKSEYERVTSGTEAWCGTGRYAQGENGERIDVLERIFRGGGIATKGDDEPGKMLSPFKMSREEALGEAEGESEGGSSGNYNTGSNIAGDYPIMLGVKNMEGDQPLANLPWDEVKAEGGVSLDNFTHIEVPKEYVKETRALLEKYGVALPVVAMGVGTAVMLDKIEKVAAEEGEEEAEKLAEEGEPEGEYDGPAPEEMEDAEKIKELKQRLVNEAKDYYEIEEEGAEMPGLMQKYLGDATGVVKGVKDDSKQRELDAEGYVESLMMALGQEKLEAITKEIQQDVSAGNGMSGEGTGEAEQE